MSNAKEKNGLPKPGRAPALVFVRPERLTSRHDAQPRSLSGQTQSLAFKRALKNIRMLESKLRSMYQDRERLEVFLQAAQYWLDRNLNAAQSNQQTQKSPVFMLVRRWQDSFENIIDSSCHGTVGSPYSYSIIVEPTNSEGGSGGDVTMAEVQRQCLLWQEFNQRFISPRLYELEMQILELGKIVGETLMALRSLNTDSLFLRAAIEREIRRVEENNFTKEICRATERDWLALDLSGRVQKLLTIVNLLSPSVYGICYHFKRLAATITCHG